MVCDAMQEEESYIKMTECMGKWKCLTEFKVVNNMQ